MDPLHTREERWRGQQAFGSVDEVADLIEELVELVLKAGSEGIDPQIVSIRYFDKRYMGMPLGDLRELAPALELDGADIFVRAEPGGQPEPVGIEFNVFNSDSHPSAGLSVKGQDEVAVNGVFIAAKDRINKLYERKRYAEKLAAEAESSEASTPEGPTPTWRKVVYNPYSVQIGGGLVLLAVGLVLGLLIGSR